MCAVRWDCAGCSLTSATRKTASGWCSWHNTIGSAPVQRPQQFHSVIIFFHYLNFILYELSDSGPRPLDAPEHVLVQQPQGGLHGVPLVRAVGEGPHAQHRHAQLLRLLQRLDRLHAQPPAPVTAAAGQPPRPLT